MKGAQLACSLCIISCGPIWLTGCDTQAARPAGAAVQDAALKNELKEISRRLHNLEYPELRKRDPREISILQVRVDAREATFNEVSARFVVGAAPTKEMVTAGYHLAVARADLAWAKQNVHDAVKRLVEAADFAADMVEAAEACYEAGVMEATLCSVLEAQTLLANAELALIRAEKVAAVAKVDISDIELDPDKRSRERETPPRDVVPPLPGESDLPFPDGVEPPGLPLPPVGIEPPRSHGPEPSSPDESVPSLPANREIE